MKNKLGFLETEKRKYPIVFNLNIMEELQDKYGSFSAWGDIVENNGKEPNVKELKFGLMIMINEAIEIENENTGNNESLVNEKQVGRIISEIGINNLYKQIKTLTINSAKVDDEPKNE